MKRNIIFITICLAAVFSFSISPVSAETSSKTPWCSKADYEDLQLDGAGVLASLSHKEKDPAMDVEEGVYAEIAGKIYKVSKDVIYTSNDRGKTVTESSFGPGNCVGYRLDPSDAIETLWLLKQGSGMPKKEKSTKTASSDPNEKKTAADAKKTKLKKSGGVWKNY